MFKKLDNNTVQSSEGYLVATLSIWKARYSDSDKEAIVQIEGGRDESGNLEWSIYSRTLSGNRFLSKSEAREILNRISHGLTFLGMPNQVV